MRPFMAAAGITAVLFSGVACGSGSDTSTPTSLGSSGAAATPASTGNTATVCAEVKRLNGRVPRSLETTFKEALSTAAESKTSDAKGEKLLDDALKSMKAEAGEWIAGLKQQSADATDPGLSKVIADVAKELAPIFAGEGSMQEMTKIVQRAEADLAPYCGGKPVVAESRTEASGPIGVGPGKGCPAPIAFETAEKWKPVPITDQDIDGIPLTDEGLTLLCEIDAKPAGNIGFIRVWKVQAANPRAALRDEVLGWSHGKRLTYDEITVGGRDAVEVNYTASGTPGQAFVVTATNGDFIVVDWKGFDKEEHEAGLPAYELARSSLSYP
jgi:hypothetical protein